MPLDCLRCPKTQVRAIPSKGPVWGGSTQNLKWIRQISRELELRHPSAALGSYVWSERTCAGITFVTNAKNANWVLWDPMWDFSQPQVVPFLRTLEVRGALSVRCSTVVRRNATEHEIVQYQATKRRLSSTTCFVSWLPIPYLCFWYYCLRMLQELQLEWHWLRRSWHVISRSAAGVIFSSARMKKHSHCKDVIIFDFLHPYRRKRT